MGNAAIAENLRLLSSYYKSVAEVCRRLDINRQQFNKYLSGQTAPVPPHPAAHLQFLWRRGL